MNNPVGWFEIYVNDLARAKAFYEAIFEVELSALENMGDMLMFPMQDGQFGASGALVKMPEIASGGNSVLVYFSCEDCAIEAARVVKAGGKLVQGKASIGEYGHFALAIDTEGNQIGLHSLK